ncbi:hypothetical protein AC1031_012804 [Aphanomyces cochlioides]|nr:hypothetical protein AC1031_012804 [Aphanomyces cochlioides]
MQELGLHKPGATEHLDRCVIVYSSLSKWTSRRINTFSNWDDLLQTMMASGCLPPFTIPPFVFKGEWVIDGGLFEFQPMLDDDTVTISPLYFSKADIRPTQCVPLYDAYQWAIKHGYTTKTYIPPMPLDTPHFQTKVGNFWGYQSMDNRLLDVFFVASVAMVGKPVAFSLVYAELLVRAVGQAVESVKLATSNAGLSRWIVISSLVLGFTFTAALLPIGILECLGGPLCLLLVYCALQPARDDKACLVCSTFRLSWTTPQSQSTRSTWGTRTSNHPSTCLCGGCFFPQSPAVSSGCTILANTTLTNQA